MKFSPLSFGTLLLLGGCSPAFLVNAYHIPQTTKVARAQQVYAGDIGGGDSSVRLINYYVQVCDLADGKASNCQTTLVLDNVVTIQTRWR